MSSHPSPMDMQKRQMMIQLGHLGFLSLILKACGQQSSQDKESVRWQVVGSTQITSDGTHRLIQSKGLPTHSTGTFPNPGCPFPILEQKHNFKVPVTPKDLAEPRFSKTWRVGIGINGVLFEPWGPSWKQDCNTGWTYEDCGAQVREHLGVDQNNAHVQGSGSYHYHGYPQGLVEEAQKLSGSNPMVLIGFAADGYPIYDSLGPKAPMDLDSEKISLKPSYRLKSGERPSGGPGGVYDGTFNEDYEFVEGLGDLDKCNGRKGITPEFPGGTYYYVVTKSYPYIPRFFKAEPHSSFAVPEEACFAPLPPSLGGDPEKNKPENDPSKRPPRI